jgi:lactoylglutathione lyase
MIKGLYETHLFVKNLENSIDFYQNKLGLELCHMEAERRVAFFWIGKPKEAMLGLWEKPEEEVCRLHMAFRADIDDVLNKSGTFLLERSVKPYNFLKDGTDMPIVFCWMPAMSIYFDDPDGNVLEFIAVLKGKGRPDLGLVTYDEWLKLE